MEIENCKRSNFLCVFFLFTLVIQSVVYLFWARAGIDLTDESVYYLTYLYPSEIKAHTTFDYVLLSHIFRWFHHDIWLMRVFIFIVGLLSTLPFAWVLNYLTARSEKTNLNIDLLTSILITLSLSFLIHASGAPIAPSYNHLTCAYVFLSSGFFLIYTIVPHLKQRTHTTLLILSGLFCGLCFFTKISTGLLLIGLESIILLFRINSPNKFRNFFYFYLGIACLVIFYFLFLIYPVNWWTQFTFALNKVSQTGHIKNPAWVRASNEIRSTFSQSIALFWPVHLLTIISGISQLAAERIRKGKLFSVFNLCIIICAFAFFVFNWTETLPKQLPFGGQSLTYHFFGLVLVYLHLLLWTTFHRARPENLLRNRLSRSFLSQSLLFLFSLSIPFIASFGTGNHIADNASLQVTVWAIFIIFFGFYLSNLLKIRSIYYFSTCAIGLLSAVFFINTYLFHPYRYNNSRLDQTIPIEFGPGKTQLWIDPDTYEFLTHLKNRLQKVGFTEGDDLLVFYDLPGAPLFMGAKSPGHPWYFSSRIYVEHNILSLQSASLSRIRKSFVLEEVGRETIEEAASVLSKIGITLTKDYMLLDSFQLKRVNKTYRLWKPILQN